MSDQTTDLSLDRGWGEGFDDSELQQAIKRRIREDADRDRQDGDYGAWLWPR